MSAQRHSPGTRMRPRLPLSGPHEPIIHCRSLTHVLRWCACVQAPFGDAPDTTKPPFSASQLSSYLATPSAHTMPPVRLEHLCVDTLRELEGRSRRSIERRLAALAAHDVDHQSTTPKAHAWDSLPPSLRAVLWLRHGPSAQSAALAEVGRPPYKASLKEAVASMVPLARLAERASGWQQLLGLPLDDDADSENTDAPPAKRRRLPKAEDGEGRLPKAEDCGGGGGGGKPRWPDAASWRRIAARTGGVSPSPCSSPCTTLCVHKPHDSSPEPRCEDCHADPDGLAVSLSIDKRAGAREGHWEARVCVTCVGEARSIRRISISEDLATGWPEKVEQLEPRVAKRLRAIATRDIHLCPPALLHGPGCFLEVAVKLPRVPDRVPEAPPVLRVVEVATA